MTNLQDRLIVTAASRSYRPSLLALLGSLTLNWPGHPPVLVYDIGLDDATRAILMRHRVNIVRVPPFCPHWRRHYTWKLWCWRHAPAENVLWIDAGIAVLQPLDEVFGAIEEQGYFVVPNGMPLALEASEAACRGCGVKPEFRTGRPVYSAGLVGVCRKGPVQGLLEEALRVGMVEEHIAATSPHHRHEQAIFSLLMHKYLDPVRAADPNRYHAERSPLQTPDQKVWWHRRHAMRASDKAHLAAHVSEPGRPYRPRPPHWWHGKFPVDRMRSWFTKRRSAMPDGVRD